MALQPVANAMKVLQPCFTRLEIQANFKILNLTTFVKMILKIIIIMLPVKVVGILE